MKIKVTVHIHHQKYEWEDKGQYLVYSCKLDDTDYRAHVCEQEIEIEVPDNFDPRAQQIAALEDQKKRVMAEYQNAVTEINDRISKLQALEYTA
jgi:bacillopeptidase F (M6 metalloprotease family)